MAANIGTLEGLIVLRDQFTGVLNRAGDKVAGVGKKMEVTGRRMTQVGQGMTTALTLPLVAVGIGAIKMSNDFSLAMTKIETLVGLSAEEVDGFKDKVKELAGETARSPKELADAMFFITSAGLSGTDALEALDAAAKAAAIGLGDTAAIADATTSAMNAYGPANLSASKATNILALAVRKGKLEASELAPVLGRLLPTASSMGIAFADVAGVLATMSRTGLNAAEASTSLNAVMTTMLKGGSQEAKDTLKDVGLSMQGLRDTARGPGGLIAAMRLLDDKTKHLSEDTMVKIVPNVRAFRGVMNVLAQDTEIVDEVMREVASDIDVLGEGMAILASEPGFRFSQLLQKAKVQLIELGDELAPTFEKLLDFGSKLLQWVANAVEWFASLDASGKGVVVAIVGITAAIGPVLLIGGKLLILFGSVASAAPILTAKITAMLGPWGLIALAIAAVVLAANKWISIQNAQHAAMIETVAGANQYNVAMFDLKKEILAAKLEQRDLNAETIKFAGQGLAALKVRLEAAKKELDRLATSQGGLTKTIRAGGQVVVTTTEDYRDQQGIVRELQNTFDATNDMLHETAEAYVELTEPVKVVSKATTETADSAKKLGQVSGELAAALKSTGGEVLDLTIKVDNSLDAMVNADRGTTQYTDKFKLLERAVKGSRLPFGQYLELMRDLTVEIAKNGDKTGELKEAQERLKNVWVSSRDAMVELRDAASDVGISHENLLDILNELGFETDDLTMTQEQLAMALGVVGRSAEEAGSDMGAMADAFADAIVAVILGAQSIGDALRGIFDVEFRKNTTKFFKDFSKAFRDVKTDSVTTAAAMKHSWQEAKESLQGTFAAISSAMAAASGETEGLLVGIATVAANWNTNPAAAAIAGFGVLAGVLKLLTGHTRDAADVAKEFGLTLSKELLAAIDGVAGRIKDLDAAFLLLLDDTIKEVGIQNLGDLGKFMSLIRDLMGELAGATVDVVEAFDGMPDSIDDVTDSTLKQSEVTLALGSALFELVNRFREAGGGIGAFNELAKIYVDMLDEVVAGNMSAAAAGEILGNTLNELVEIAIELGDGAVEAIQSIVDAARAAGVDTAFLAEALETAYERAFAVLKERNAFIITQSEALLAGLEKMFAGSAKASKKEVEFAATAVLQAFDAMFAAGASITDILAAIGDAFNAIREQGAELGVELPEAFERLGEIIDILAREGIANAISALEGMAAATSALGNMGLLTADQFDAFGDSIDRAFNKLVNQGLSAEEALAVLAPQLQLLNDLSEMYGFELDNNTQKLIDQAKAQGLVKDKGLDTNDILIEGFDRMLIAINALIVALGGVPVEFDDWGRAADDATEKVLIDMGDVEDSIADVAKNGARHFGDLGNATKDAAHDADAAWWETAQTIPPRIKRMVDEMENDLRDIPVSFKIQESDAGVRGFRSGFSSDVGVGDLLADEEFENVHEESAELATLLRIEEMIGTLPQRQGY